MENILTLGKLLSLWFCFLLHSILFLISQTSYRTYKIISSYELARPIMGTIFLVRSIMLKEKHNQAHYPRAQESRGVIGRCPYMCVQKKIVIERTRDLIYLKFVATDFRK